MRRIDLLATDLDRTFLDAHGQVSPVNRAAIRHAAESGVKVVFATGRPYRWLSVLDEFAPLEPVVLASNGAVSVDLASGEVLADSPVPPQVVADVVAQVRAEIPEALWCTEEARTWYAEPGFDRWQLAGPPDAQGPIEEFLGPDHRVVKVLVRAFGVNTETLFARVAPAVGERATVTFSALLDDGLVEISATGASKGAALARECAALGIDPARAAAFGDMPNDASMLDLVGFPHVVSNGHPRLLGAGHPVIGRHDESAVGRQIEALLADSQPVATPK